MTKPTPDRVFDAGDQLCGELALALRREVSQLPPGGVLEVIARDLAAPQDVPAWCEVTGNALLHAEHPHYWLRRKA